MKFAWFHPPQVDSDEIAAQFTSKLEDYQDRDDVALSSGGGGLHFGLKKTSKITIIIEDLSRNSFFFRTEVKPKADCSWT